MDTVDGTDEQFVPRTHAGRLYGRGACDTKGSAAAMMTALCRLAASRKRPAETEIVFAGLIDEEHAQAGSRALTRNGFQAALAVIGEPTRLKVVTAHKGSLWVRLETRGKSAHGSRPELGRNAIHDMARIIKLLETEYAAALSRRRHPLLGTATVNVGIINGGIQPNIVPDRCSLTLDRRTLPGETQATVWRELAELLRLNKLQGFLADDKAAPCLPMETDPSLPLVARFLKTVRQREPAGVHYFCDAANLSAAGIPSVVFGPGDIAQGHTADEWIEVAAVERAAALLFEFLASLP
jgi:acetylornithine deacetylase